MVSRFPNSIIFNWLDQHWCVYNPFKKELKYFSFCTFWLWPHIDVLLLYLRLLWLECLAEHWLSSLRGVKFSNLFYCSHSVTLCECYHCPSVVVLPFPAATVHYKSCPVDIKYSSSRDIIKECEERFPFPHESKKNKSFWVSTPVYNLSHETPCFSDRVLQWKPVNACKKDN